MSRVPGFMLARRTWHPHLPADGYREDSTSAELPHRLKIEINYLAGARAEIYKLNFDGPVWPGNGDHPACIVRQNGP